MEIRIVIVPSQGAWAVLSPVFEPLIFRSGGRAEAAARQLAQALAMNGAASSIIVHDNTGAVVGAHFSRAVELGQQTVMGRVCSAAWK